MQHLKLKQIDHYKFNGIEIIVYVKNISQYLKDVSGVRNKNDRYFYW